MVNLSIKSSFLMLVARKNKPETKDTNICWFLAACSGNLVENLDILMGKSWKVSISTLMRLFMINCGQYEDSLEYLPTPSLVFPGFNRNMSL